MDSHGSPTTTASSGSTYNKCCSSTTSASFNTSIEQEVSMNVEEVLHQNVNNVLMNPIKKPRKTYSVNITDIDQKVVERGFITEYYDCGFHYAIDPNIASHKAKPSKINAVFKDINAKIKHICHPKVMDRPSDELNPLHNIPVWPHVSDKPDTSSTEWENWSKRREELADTIVKALTSAYVGKTSFKGTISAIYNKLNSKTS
mmetsp:Transcript_33721/g.48933  ORF Transcript_33721/g.48933 Transcript_33721/m.48933 type:complete len:202 (+) Transcript_33721:1172-1777(+)